MSFNLDRHFNNEFDAEANFQDFHRRNQVLMNISVLLAKVIIICNLFYFQKTQPSYNFNHINYNDTFNQNDQGRSYPIVDPQLPQQQYACQKCNFFSNDSQAILAHLHSAFHLNGRPASASWYPFQFAEQPLNSPTFDNPHLVSSNFKL
jgi:hypothetical protein